MISPMPILDDRTDVLKAMVSKPLTTASLPTVVRELSNVVLILSSDVFEIARLVKGDNGSGGGLVQQMHEMQRDVKAILTKLDETKAETDKAEEAAKSATVNTPFSRLVQWFCDKVLPGLITAVIMGGAALLVATWLHLKISQGTP